MPLQLFTSRRGCGDPLAPDLPVVVGDVTPGPQSLRTYADFVNREHQLAVKHSQRQRSA